MTYDYKQKKIVAVISSEIESWQALNVLGHMSVSLGANRDDDLMGRSVLMDASGFEHKGIARFGFIIKEGSAEDISDLVKKAKDNQALILVDFPQEMLDTKHDDELHESMRLKKAEDFTYLGCLLYGPADTVDEITRGYKLWS